MRMPGQIRVGGRIFTIKHPYKFDDHNTPEVSLTTTRYARNVPAPIFCLTAHNGIAGIVAADG